MVGHSYKDSGQPAEPAHSGLALQTAFWEIEREVAWRLLIPSPLASAPWNDSKIAASISGVLWSLLALSFALGAPSHFPGQGC
jgi:hypothetical protein